MLSNVNDLYSFASGMADWLVITLTRYCELVRLGAPIMIEKLLRVDPVASLFLLPRDMPNPHLDLRAHLGCRRNLSTYAQASVIVCRGEERTYRRWAGAQVRLSFFCNSISSFSTNNWSRYFDFGMYCNEISIWYTK